MALFVVTYRYHPEPSRMARLRPARYEYFADLAARGVLRGSGQLTDEELADGLMVLDVIDRAAARALVERDPFVVEGLVRELTLDRWRATAGSWVQG